MASPPPGEQAERLRASLAALLAATGREEAAQHEAIAAALPRHRLSAANLAHYLGLRKLDIHRLQLELAAIGLSSLGRCEGHVRDTLTRLCAWLAGERGDAIVDAAGDGLDRAKAESILHANTRALFGPRPRDRHVYIMVTAPDAAAADAVWADGVLEAGADLLRINGSHESPAEWAAIAATFKARAAAFCRPGRVFVDLPGPKLRTEIRQLERGVLHLPRRKDRMGRTLAPTQVQLVAQHESGPQIPVPAAWLARLEAGDLIALTDAGGRERTLTVRAPGREKVRAECDRSLYVTTGLPIVWRRGEKSMGEDRIGALPRQPRELRVAAGDAFVLNETGLSSDPEVRALAFPEPGLLAQVQPGERVILDDGKLVAVAEGMSPEGLVCRVRELMKSPARLRSGKGIAFPDSALSLGHLGPQDEAAIAFALEHADGVGVSFVAGARDVALVGERIRQAGKPGFGMILKLETRGAVANLAGILFEALKYDPVGIMIARGDLAVELSFERLAEMQEELLWFGEACHLPVVWATQVLDTVAHSGLPTRAEVTDAAMSMRAECVMLNKGPYISAATRMLADIIRKMEAHQYKKRSLFRQLAVARGPG
ncbi:MAG: pyruvate kinase [Burkholderiales bacterium]|nr:pyruvate kinase [Burkholderiales bacterium]